MLNHQHFPNPSFRTHLETCKIARTTIKVYISITQYMHVSAGLHANSNSKLTPCLQLTLTGIQRNQATSHPQEFVYSYQLRTLQIMQPINNLLINQLYSCTNILIWAVCCLPFFGLLWINEFTIPSDNSYDKECLPSPVDVSVYDHTNYQLLRVKIKQ